MSSIPALSSSIGLVRSLVEMRSEMVDLDRQFITGKKAETYGGLGAGRDTSLAMRGKLSRISGYQDAAEQVGLRVSLMNESLTRLSGIGQEAKAAARETSLNLSGGQQTSAQKGAMQRLDEAITNLNESVAGRHLFSGRATDEVPLESAATMLNGQGGRDGFKTVVDERQAADLGQDRRGRVETGIDAGAPSRVFLSEDGDHPFGFKLNAVSGPAGFAGTLEQPADARPRAMGVDFAGANVVNGQEFRVSLDLPDGTREEIVLKAQADGPADRDGFVIGDSAEETAANFAGALDDSLARRAESSLMAASAFASAENFFRSDDQPVQRVRAAPGGGDPVVLENGAEGETVRWYKGDNAPDIDPRAGAKARIDDGVSVEYGMRANEEPLARLVGTLAVFASEEFGVTGPRLTAGADFAEIDLSADADNTFSFDLNGETIVLGQADGGGDGMLDIDEAVAAIQDRIDANPALSQAGVEVARGTGGEAGRLVLTSAEQGAVASLSVDNFALGGTANAAAPSDLGFADGAEARGANNAANQNEAARYKATMQRVQGELDGTGKSRTVETMTAELASVDSSLERARESLRTETGMLEDMLEDVEGVSAEEVAMRLLSLQSHMQMSYEATAMLSRMSLANYL